MSSPWLRQRRYCHQQLRWSGASCFLHSVVLLLQEGGRSKSHRYWPKLGSKHNSATHGKFKVTTKFRTDSGCYATTGLKVKHLLSGQERTVWHLQYTDWPERGCPEYVQGFLCKSDRSVFHPARDPSIHLFSRNPQRIWKRSSQSGVTRTACWTRRRV